MKRTLALALAAGFGLPAFAQDPPPKVVPATPLKKPGEDPPKADDKKDEKKPETRDEKVAALQKDLSAEQQALIKEYNAEEDKDAKNKLRTKINGLPASYVDKALALVEENPKDEAALRAIQFVTTYGRGKPVSDATKLLVAHHVENPKIADMVVPLSRNVTAETTSFLKAVLARNPDRDAKGRAAYLLASGLADQIENAKTDEAATKLETETLAMLKRIGDEFADVHLMKIPANVKATPRLLGKLAAADAKGIGNIKNLRVGKAAPEIEGPDMDEKMFKLSDYKGKVVLIDFWGHW
jgi:hypothetical protein